MPHHSNIRRFILVAAIAVTTAVMAHATAPEPPDVGSAAPAFELEDLDGKTIRLADLRGKVVVLEWMNPTCPYSRRIHESRLVERTLDAIEPPGSVVYLAVNSTGDVPRLEVVAQSRALIDATELARRIRVLVDHDGSVARRFGARTTPHVFVIDRGGVIRYSGAYTDDPRGRRKDAVNYVRQTLDRIASGDPVVPEHTDPWGCRIRFATSPREPG